MIDMHNELILSDTILYFLKIVSVKDCVRIVRKHTLDISFLDEVFSYLRKKDKVIPILKILDKFIFNENLTLKNKFIFEFGL